MTNYGIIFDSSCGVSKKQVERDGHFFIPINIIINEKIHRAGDEIFAKDLYKTMQDKKVNVSTSSATGEDIKEAFEKGLKKFDQLIYIGMSHKFSATQENVRMIAEEYEEYKGRIHIYNSIYSSPWTFLLYKDIIKIIKEGKNIEEIFNTLDFQNDKMVGYLSPGDIYWLYKGGRITKSQYIIGNTLRIKPILTIKNGEVNKENTDKARTLKGALKKMYDNCQSLKKIAESIKATYSYVIIYAGDKELTNQSVDIILENEKNLKKRDIIITEISPEQVAHMGPNSFGMTVKIDFPKIKTT